MQNRTINQNMSSRAILELNKILALLNSHQFPNNLHCMIVVMDPSTGECELDSTLLGKQAAKILRNAADAVEKMDK